MSNPSNSDEAVDDMQSAFQQFMLSGGGRASNAGSINTNSGRKKKKKGRNPPYAAGASHFQSPPTTGNEHQHTVQQNKIRKQIWQIFNAFRKTLQEDWLEVDDHLGDVLASVVELRNRILTISKSLHFFHQNHKESTTTGSEGYGFRSRPTGPVVAGYLTQEDVEMALSHSLLQHEKMLAGARKLMAALNQALEMLGRRLDELMTYHLETSSLLGADLAVFAGHVVQWSRQVYTELGQELYRKQQLVQTVLDSVEDGLLFQEDYIDEETSPLQTAQSCHNDWPRGGADEKRRDFMNNLLASTPWEESEGDEERI